MLASFVVTQAFGFTTVQAKNRSPTIGFRKVLSIRLGAVVAALAPNREGMEKRGYWEGMPIVVRRIPVVVHI